MLKFNNSNIFTGYLKQLLNSVEIPNFKIYSRENLKYLNSKEYLSSGIEKQIIPSMYYKKEDANTGIFKTSIPYIKDGKIKYYKIEKTGETTNSTPIWSYTWIEASNIAAESLITATKNNVKNLIIKNNIYDSYTHKCLGNFLRYLRDDKDINLMPLYNCFSDEMPDLLDCAFKISYNSGSEDSRTLEKTFKTSDKKYKIYMVPVKYLKEYTIAIDCNSPIEMFCGFYTTKFLTTTTTNDTTGMEAFFKQTYKKYNKMCFTTPVIYNKLSWDNIAESYLTMTGTSIDFAEMEEYLKLFIKIPTDTKSSIVVLEGNYLNFNDRRYVLDKKVWNNKEQKWITLNNPLQDANYFVVNFDGYKERLEDNKEVFKPITYLQLLSQNTGISYPFADRLIEYLIGNTITSEDDLEDNIKRIQTIMKENKIYNNTNYFGMWDDLIKPVVYSYMQKHNTNSLYNHDLLGYVDKDIEDNYKSANNTLKDVDIYEDIYLAAKAKVVKR